MIRFPLVEIAEYIGASIQGSKDITITGLAPLNSAQHGTLSFLDNPSYKQYLNTTQASAVIITPQYADECQIPALIINNPYLAYAKVSQLFETNNIVQVGIHPTAQVDPKAAIAPSVSIGACTVIEGDVRIEEDVVIGSHCYIGPNTCIKKASRLAARVTIYKNTQIGSEVIIHSGAVIGSDGFGYANDKGQWIKIAQLGGVVIGDEVEIGANTTIDRGALENTTIARGVKLDNLIQIAHNVCIGEHTAIAGCVGIAGSTKIGKYCMIGGFTAIGGHLEITDRVVLTGMSMVTQSIKQPGLYSSGTGLQPNNEWHKSVARFRQLDKPARKVATLEKQLANKGALHE